MRVGEIMTRDVRTCRAEDDAAEAARIMWEQDCGCVPVLNEHGFPIAMVTDRDLCMAAYTRGARLHDMRVATIMSHAIVTCSDDDSIEQAERRMAEAQVRRLPVVDRTGKLIGLLSLNDVARARATMPVERARGMLLGDLTRTLAAVCEPRPHPERATEPPLVCAE